MIKLVVSDLDGTLLTDQHQLPSAFLPLAKQLFAAGIKLAIATGRSHASIVENFAPIADRLHAVSDNGGLIRFGKEELLCKPLQTPDVHSLIEAGRGIDKAWPILCGKDLWFIENTDQAFLDKVHQYTRNYEVVNDLTKVDAPVLKFTVCDLAGAEQNSLVKFRSFDHSLKLAVGGAVWLDITMPGVHKGEAIRHLQERYSISPDETLVFGDMLNDYEMMQAASYSYAMKNAHPRLKEVARFVTDKDNNSGGVLEVILKHCFQAAAGTTVTA